MISFVTKRLLQSLFVLFAVVSAVFILQNESTLDPVEDYLLAAFGDLPYDSEQFTKAYETESIAQNKHLPKFYWAIIPSYFPRDLYKTLVVSERKLIKKLLRSSQCSDCVEDFITVRKGLLDLSLDTLTLSKRSLMIRLCRENDFVQLGNLLSRPDLETSDDKINQQVRGLKAIWNELQPNEKKITMPKVVWYGSNNQYHQYFADLLGGRMGKSKLDGRSAGLKIKNALKWTLSMNTVTFVLAGFLGLALGLWRTKHDGTIKERIFSSILLFIYTIPVFWLGTLAVVFFTTPEYGSWTHIFPSVGIKYWYSDQPISRQIALNAGQLILPIICMTLPSLAYMSRIMKSKFSEVIASQFIIPLRAKGLDENTLLRKHILPNGLIPFITIMTGSIPGLFTGSLVIEVIFNIPGIGKLLMDSIIATDWAVVSGLVIMLSIVTVTAYLLADILYSWANPKIKSQNT